MQKNYSNQMDLRLKLKFNALITLSGQDLESFFGVKDIQELEGVQLVNAA